MNRRFGIRWPLVVILLAAACGASPATSVGPSVTPDATTVGLPPASVDREEAVAIAREASRQIQRWLGSGKVVMARQDRFADVRNTFAPRVSPAPADDRLVWTIRIFDEGSQQGTTVIVDALDGRVLQAASYIA